MRKIADEKTINKMISDYCENSSESNNELFNFHTNYEFTEEQILKLGRIFDLQSYIFFLWAEGKKIPFEIVDKYIKNNKVDYAFSQIICSVYTEIIDIDFIKKYQNVINLQLMLLYKNGKKLTAREVGKIINSPEIGRTLVKDGDKQYVTKYVSKNNMNVICEEKNTNIMYEFTLRKNGQYKIKNKR